MVSGNWPAGVRQGLLFGQPQIKLSRKTGAEKEEEEEEEVYIDLSKY